MTTNELPKIDGREPRVRKANEGRYVIDAGSDTGYRLCRDGVWRGWFTEIDAKTHEWIWPTRESAEQFIRDVAARGPAVKTTVVPGGEVERLQKQLQDTQLFGVSLMNQLRASQEEVERLRAYNQSIKSSITEALGLCDATCDWGLAVSVIQAQKLRVERLRAENAELRRQVEGIEQSRDDMLDAAELYMDKLDAAQAELAELRQQLKRLAEILGPLLPIQEPYGPYARILLNRAEAREVVELLK